MKVVITWLIMILILSVMPLEGMFTKRVEFGDKAVHFIIYAITAVLFYTEFLRSRNPSVRRWSLWLALFSASGYGLLMEFVQGVLTTARAFSFIDVEINVLGATTGLLLVKYLRRIPRAGTRKD